ncbi:biotin transporter BioY [Streptococcus himalayensis]|uniref:Biotin transporter n=1 Tax=Streptococcus himalayensis TaxID=1888195 RepID=A0A917EFZ0_9STRE|nr:biotin transporter BioY [Streptococcus himalayensis]GGE36627.1 BioY family transporter [Streptococcus himalayensis]
MKQYTTLTLPALGAAFIAVLAQITLPIGPVPFSLQNMAIGLIATLFKPREALLSTLLYLLLGSIGLPVFAGGHGGVSALIGPSAGYLWAYIAYAGLTSYLTKPKSPISAIFFANLLGDSLVFVGGCLGLHILASMPVAKIWLLGVLPFILPDLVKILVISLISRELFRHLGQHTYFKS